MAFQPAVLNPTPVPWFVRDLRRIDSDLRVVWGYSRYMVQQWAIERKIPPERYFKMYESVLSGDGPRVVMQPIFDVLQPTYDENGAFICYRQVGQRAFDLAPEYEWVRFEKTLDDTVLSQLKRSYAWERNHPISRLRVEKQQQLAAEKAAAKKKRMDAIDVRESVKEVMLETHKHKQFGYGKARSDG